jgi:hypothetical protein
MGSSRPRNSTRASRGRSVRTSSKPSRKSPAAAVMARRLTRRKTGDVDAPSGDSPPAGTLQSIQYRLELIRSSVVVVAHALMEQNCELDEDAARVLRYHVTVALTDQMVQIGLLLHGGAS